MKRYIMIVIVALAVLLISCQPTPTDEIVQSKESDSIKRAIEQTEQVDEVSFSAPITWSETYDDQIKGITIHVDAEVIVPNDRWSIYHLQPKAITKGEAMTMVQAVVGHDAPIVYEQVRSADVIEEGIVCIKAEMADAKAKGEDTLYEVLEEKLKEYTKDLQRAKASEPDSEPIMLISQIEALFDGTTDDHAWQIHTGQDDLATVHTMTTNGYFGFTYRNLGAIGCFYQRHEYHGQPLRGVDMSYEEAKRVARNMVKAMGFNYLDIAEPHIQDIDYGQGESIDMPQCYEFAFTRVLDGFPVTYASRRGRSEADYTRYAYDWSVREIVVDVNDDGVIYLEVKVPKSDVVQLVSGVELMAFEEIMDIFKKQATIEGCYALELPDYVIHHREIAIDEIRLGYMPTAWKDHPNQIIFVPVWDFFGEEITVYEKDDTIEYVHHEIEEVDGMWHRRVDLESKAILTINAIDGTIMQRLVERD